MEQILFVLKISFIFNLFLWGLLLIFPPIIVPVKSIFHTGLRALGMSVLNFIFLKHGYIREPILRHELAHFRQLQLFSPFGITLIAFFHFLFLFIRYRSSLLVYQHSAFEKHANSKMYDSTELPGVLVWDIQRKQCKYFPVGSENVVSEIVKISKNLSGSE